MQFPTKPDRLPATMALLVLFLSLFHSAGAEPDAAEFPPELVHWVPYQGNPVFTGTGRDTWDRQIRERGYILQEGPIWRLWYTGHNQDRTKELALGYVTSTNGLAWNRVGDKPIFSDRWTEDMMVARVNGTYYMAAEGLHDVAHLLTSADAVHWTDQGDFDIRQVDGEPLSKGPYGTPTLWIEDGIWYLFYERNDDAIWLAKSTDRKVWTNVQDEPVIQRGPEPYDQFGVALNQVIRYGGHFKSRSGFYAAEQVSHYRPAGPSGCMMMPVRMSLRMLAGGVTRREKKRSVGTIRNPLPTPHRQCDYCVPFVGRVDLRKLVTAEL